MPYANQFLALAGHIESIVSHGGYAILSIFTLLEGLPVIGMAVPGHAAIIAAGFLAKLGTLNLWAVILISIVGAIFGDFMGFWIGRKYGLSFIDRIRPYFFVTDVHIEKATELLSRHTGKAMVLGRFTPATRALMPFLVGANQTPVKKFWLFNILGAVSWSLVSVFVGYVFGAGFHVISGYIGKFVVLAILGAIVIIWGYRFVNMRFHVFRKYELFTLILNLLSLAILALMIQDAMAVRPFMINLDIWVSAFMNAHNSGTPFNSLLSSAAAVVDVAGGTVVMGFLGIGLTVWLAYRKKWRSVGITILGIGGTAFFVGLFKEIFLRVRPDNALQVIVNDPSFPSGHASMAAAFFTVLAYFLCLRIQSRNKRELSILLCFLAVLTIGVSRLVLNVHWFSDVLAGWSLGVFIATASILLVRYIGALILPKISEQQIKL